MPITFELPTDVDAIIRGDFFPAQPPAQGIIILAHGYKGFKRLGHVPLCGLTAKPDAPCAIL